MGFFRSVSGVFIFTSDAGEKADGKETGFSSVGLFVRLSCPSDELFLWAFGFKSGQKDSLEVLSLCESDGQFCFFATFLESNARSGGWNETRHIS